MSDSSPVAGILEIHDKGYGFLRKPERGSAPTPQDVFVPPDMIKRNGLRDGVQLSGVSVSNGRGPQLVELQEVNNRAVDIYREQLPFEELTTINPNRWIKLENGADKLSARVLDLMTPIGHGQRGLIVASPRSGKTMLMQAIADSVLTNSPDTFLMIVLIDERPEEVTDFRQFLAGRGELWSSSNDQENASHVRLAKLVIERAKRLVESGKDVFILLDSITRLGRAFNQGAKGNTMSGGISSRALEIPRKFFAAARQTEEAGALTIIATALIDTGSRMDEVIFQEFKGTGNMEIVLDRRLAEARVYPSIDIEKSGTRREELLLPKGILDKVTTIRRGLHGLPVQAQMERLLMILKKFNDNKSALDQLPVRPRGLIAMSFQDLGLSDDVIHGVQSMGFMDPTPIQLQAFPILLARKDLIGASQTGTGKTAAFMLPLLTLLQSHKAGGPRVLVLEPTRELAAQVDAASRDYSRFGNLRTTVVYGGVGYGGQETALKRGVDVLVATPGRLLDFMEKGTIKLDTIEHLVLDEADRMLDMGFMPDVRRIIEKCPKERQTLLFSATMPPEIAKLTEWALSDPQKVEIGARQSTAETVTHALYPVASSQKFDLLLEILERTHYHSVLIFCRTKVNADRIASRLESAGHKVATMHSDRSQGERTEALEGFRSGKYEVMVATDIASRGIDISTITHVINYDVPQHPDDYVHRIGRTGRAKAEGDAFTLMTAEEGPDVAAIERFIGQEIERKKLDNFKYVYSLALDDKHQHTVKKGGNIRGGRAGKGYSFGHRRK